MPKIKRQPSGAISDKTFIFTRPADRNTRAAHGLWARARCRIGALFAGPLTPVPVQWRHTYTDHSQILPSIWKAHKPHHFVSTVSQRHCFTSIISTVLPGYRDFSKQDVSLRFRVIACPFYEVETINKWITERRDGGSVISQQKGGWDLWYRNRV